MITDMHRIFAATYVAASLLGACASTLAAENDDLSLASQPASASDSVRDDTRYLRSGNFASPAWTNDAFSGTHYRRLSGNQLDFEIDQSVDGGGWDAGVGPAQEPAIPVSIVAPDATICFAYDLDLDASGGGKWWAGPKISVNWAAMTDTPSKGEWYENYVVEIANQSPADLERDLFDYFDAESLGESVIDGSVYRHIRLRYDQWGQYWSIRQDYRTDGSLPMGPILTAWTGLPQDLIFDGAKANIETHGIVRGKGRITATLPVRPSKQSGIVDTHSALQNGNC